MGGSEVHLGRREATSSICSTELRHKTLLWEHPSLTPTPTKHQLDFISKTVTGKPSFKEDLFCERSRAQAGSLWTEETWYPEGLPKKAACVSSTCLWLRTWIVTGQGVCRGEGGGPADKFQRIQEMRSVLWFLLSLKCVYASLGISVP